MKEKSRVTNIQVTSYTGLKNNYSVDITRSNNHLTWIISPTDATIERLFKLLEKYHHWKTKTLILAYDGMPTLTTTFYPEYEVKSQLV